jgi:putative ABC transport system permease protein
VEKKVNSVFQLAIKSLLNRRVSTGLTILSIALSVMLLLGVERIRSGAKESFSQTISQTDLIVGARGGNLSLLLYSVFHMGNATNNISMETYDHFVNHPAVKWTIPISLGDSHRGFRVVSTNRNYFDHYKYARNKSLTMQVGHWNENLFDVVIGSEVANRLHYKIGDPVVIAHGISSGPAILEHSDSPFKVVGILERTTTPVDRGLYISLEAMEALHIGWQSGANKNNPAHEYTKAQLRPTQITTFFAAAHARSDALRLMREVNDYEDEPLLGIIPAMTLSELWQSLSYAEVSLQVIAFFVVSVSLLGMLISIYTTLNERRREISILRAVGGSRSLTVILFVSETVFLTIAGCLLGIVFLYSGLLATQSLIQEYAGVHIPIQWLETTDLTYLLFILILGVISGMIIGYKAHRNSLIDGLMIRV